jgi:crossover junction endodeoxyribonuclease RusA
MIELFVQGSPRPQSRPRVAIRGRRAMAYNADSKDMVAWKQALDSALSEIPERGIDGSVEVTLHFSLPRPKSHYRTGKFSHLLKDSAPEDHQSRCDLDNAIKVVLDRITRSGIWIDDCQVISLTSSKRWSDCRSGGCEITIVD